MSSPRVDCATLTTHFMMAGLSRNFVTATKILHSGDFDVNAGAGDWPVIFSLVDTQSYGMVKLVADYDRTDLCILNRMNETPDQYAEYLGLSVIAALWRDAQARRGAVCR